MKKKYCFPCLLLLILSAILNIALIIAGLFWMYPMKDAAYSSGYSDGANEGVQVGFRSGLNAGRNCVTDGVPGKCDGLANFIIVNP